MKKLENINHYFGYFYTIKEKLLETNSKFQKIEIVDTDEFGKVLLLDGITQVVEKNEFQYHELMTHLALLSQTSPKSILVIGGGDGGIDKEILKHPSIQMIHHVDLDGDVIELSKKYIPSISNGAFDNPKVNVIIQDGRQFVEKSTTQYNTIIMDMTDPFGPSVMLYTYEYFLSVKKILKDEQSQFVMHIESPISRPDIFNRIYQTLNAVFPKVNIFYNYIQMYGTLWAIAICSVANDLKKISNNKIESNIEKRGMKDKLSLINGETFISMQATYPYIANILKEKCDLITDKNHDFKGIVKDFGINDNL